MAGGIRDRPSEQLAALVVMGIFCTTFMAPGIVGFIYRDDCRGMPFIPIYLMVTAGGLLALMIGNCILQLCCDMEWNISVYVLLSLWFIAGHVCVFSVYDEYKQGILHCDKTLYLFAYWTTVSIDVLLMLIGCYLLYKLICLLFAALDSLLHCLLAACVICWCKKQDI